MLEVSSNHFLIPLTINFKCSFPIKGLSTTCMHLLGAVNSQDIDMLSVSGLQAALKRRNSKVLRDNSSAQSSADTRRFSSGEVLGSHLQSPSVLAPSVATVSKKSSFSRRIRKVSTGNNQAEALDSCTLLDMHIAQIKRKLVS